MTAPRCISFPAMGSACAFHLHDAPTAVAAAAEAEVLRIEQRYSRYRPDSVLSRINRAAAAGESLEVDDETAALLDFAFACHRKSGGLFDITTGILRRVWNFPTGPVPAPADIARWLPLVGLDKVRWERPWLSFSVAGLELDLGGLGKEYAADQAAAILADAGIAHGLVDLGGDLRVIGPQPDGSPWTIHIRNPRSPGTSLAQIQLRAGGLATSGDYARALCGVDGQRLGHILNPHTGQPVQGLASVSVAATSCLVAGSIASIAMLKGRAGAEWLGGLGLPALWVGPDGRTGGTDASFQLTGEAASAPVA